MNALKTLQISMLGALALSGAAACGGMSDRLGRTAPNAENDAAGEQSPPPPDSGMEVSVPEPSETDTGVPNDAGFPGDEDKPVNGCDKHLSLTLVSPQPASTIVAPDLPSAPVFGSYLVKNSGGEPVTLTGVAVAQQNVAGTITDFRAISVVSMDANNAATALWHAEAAPNKATLETNPPPMLATSEQAVIGAGQTLRLDVLGNMAVPQPTSVAKPGEPVSGHAPRLAITGVVGVRNGVQAHACLVTGDANWMKLRKSFPQVSFTPQNEKGLADGPTELYCFEVNSATTKWPVEVKQFVFKIELSGPAGFGLCDFAVKRDGAALAKKLYAVMKTKPAGDLTAACLTASNQVAVVLDDQLVLPGKAASFCLAATATGVAGSPSVKTSFIQSGSDGTVDLCAGKPPYSPLGLVWSDLSESPHDGGCPGASKDWYGDGYIKNLGGVQKLAP